MPDWGYEYEVPFRLRRFWRTTSQFLRVVARRRSLVFPLTEVTMGNRNC